MRDTPVQDTACDEQMAYGVAGHDTPEETRKGRKPLLSRPRLTVGSPLAGRCHCEGYNGRHAVG